MDIKKRFLNLKMTKSGESVLFHVLFWVLFLGLELLILLMVNSQKKIYTYIPVRLFNLLVFYFYVLVIYPKFLNRQRFLVVILSIIPVSLIFTPYTYYLCRFFLSFGIPADDYTFAQAFFVAVWSVVIYMLYGAAYWFFQKNILNEREKRITEQTLRLQEKRVYELNLQLHDAELAYLRSQINPHFLYNSLNFFYSEVYQHSPKAAEGVLILVDIFKYALKENDANGKVALEDEIKHVENFIAFHQLRFKNSLNIKLIKEGNFRFRSIIPLIIINFVENLFKHGDLHDPANPAIIEINIFRNEFRLSTLNKIRYEPKEKSTGIGIENTRKRLEMTYGKDTNLKITDDGTFYECLLTINL